MKVPYRRSEFNTHMAFKFIVKYFKVVKHLKVFKCILLKKKLRLLFSDLVSARS